MHIQQKKTSERRTPSSTFMDFFGEVQNTENFRKKVHFQLKVPLIFSNEDVLGQNATYWNEASSS